ncbi:hypothetical protein ASPWEDRAFT_28450 [Aspergillus wentii DTO 134E9]|uniref:Uncharacterized protein n=1 Tax=Aspergillus wentii DTO 134E9 TaxID=1073089 RepID=A0A1L9RM04_ASPWE|nr:uncharacterized protein ASPWEDRAFT_28450 [Aspergillus wentii DTO 134E9]OJJ35848.1 hypothetical protein ASPWEDRAFT_28450 [Aspergillus wentii DTO 134E9]
MLSNLIYTLAVFSTGFICGSIQAPFLQPLFGNRVAQLIEMPIMAISLWKSAQTIVQRLHGRPDAASPPTDRPEGTEKQRDATFRPFSILQMLALQIGIYIGMYWRQGKTINDFLNDRDPISTGLFFLVFGVCAVLPAWASW